MNEATSKARVIPMKVMQGVAAAVQESLTRRLESEGWIRQSTIGEPRLSEMVGTYQRLGYEVRIEANQDLVDDASACSSAGAGGCSSGATTGCSGGGCSSGAKPVSIDVAPIPEEDDGADLRTVFVRKAAWSGN